MSIFPPHLKTKVEDIKLSPDTKPYLENIKSAMSPATLDRVIAISQSIAKDGNSATVRVVHMRLALEKALGETEADKLLHTSYDRAKANSVVYQAVEKGKIPRARMNHCAIDSCGSMAKVYHHWSYKEEHRLCVIPLCSRCHTLVHRGKIEIRDPLRLSILPEGTTYLSLLKT